jgi:hypothetical protein
MYRRAMHTLRRAVPVATLACCAGLAWPALAAGPTIVVSPNRAHQGDVVRVHGTASGCARGDQVTLISKAFSHRYDFAGLPAVFARVGAHHAYSVKTRIPAHRAPRRYAISGRCGGGNLGVTASLRVLR